MRKMDFAVAFFVATLAIVPASAAVTVDFDTDVNFSAYKTFAWKVGTPAESSLMDKRIMKVVEQQLATVGLMPTDGDPDLYLLYHVALDTTRRVNVDDFGYMGRWRRPIAGSVDVDVYDVEVGTLIVDLLDAGNGETVWRGMAENDMPSNPTPDKVEKKLNKVLSKMLRKYPSE
ncbi:MAG: DUF4136 domain-containing protein [Acidobacteriota bacterium]|nr:DUF4136 domain-containing protein [Acidobacteriota bacterium]MDH3785727.1 DUF4136 domain-containing protein [Acidobacteriota bacterium]